jgi:hypothetical protein
MLIRIRLPTWLAGRLFDSLLSFCSKLLGLGA